MGVPGIIMPTAKDIEFKRRMIQILHWSMEPKEFIDVGFSNTWDEIWQQVYNGKKPK